MAVAVRKPISVGAVMPRNLTNELWDVVLYVFKCPACGCPASYAMECLHGACMDCTNFKLPQIYCVHLECLYFFEPSARDVVYQHRVSYLKGGVFLSATP